MRAAGARWAGASRPGCALRVRRTRGSFVGADNVVAAQALAGIAKAGGGAVLVSAQEASPRPGIQEIAERSRYGSPVNWISDSVSLAVL